MKADNRISNVNRKAEEYRYHRVLTLNLSLFDEGFRDRSDRTSMTMALTSVHHRSELHSDSLT